jgi:DNA-binding response OmpR family regulator
LPIPLVLAASPDEGLRTQIRLTLGVGQLELMEAADTEGAIRQVAAVVPSLLVLDLALPGALALARTLRSQPETAHVRTLLLVARGGEAPRAPEGVDGSLAVPTTSFALLRRVAALLREDGPVPFVR